MIIVSVLKISKEFTPKHAQWLHKQLKKGGAACIDDVFFAFLGSDGILHIQRKHETGGEAVYIHTEKKGTEKEK